MNEIVTPTDIPARVEEIVELIDFAQWHWAPFEGTVYGDAYPVMEAMYRYALRGNFQSPAQDRFSNEIRRAAVETWPRHSEAPFLISQRLSMMKAIPGQYANFPISVWPIDRLTEEWVRIKELLAILNSINNIIGIGGDANTVAGIGAGLAIAKGGATIVRASGLVGIGITVISGLGLRIAIIRTNAFSQEIEEEIETVRIPNGEISEADWQAIEHRVLDAQN